MFLTCHRWCGSGRGSRSCLYVRHSNCRQTCIFCNGGWFWQHFTAETPQGPWWNACHATTKSVSKEILLLSTVGPRVCRTWENLWPHTLGPLNQSEVVSESKSDSSFLKSASDWIVTFRGPNVCSQRLSYVWLPLMNSRLFTSEKTLCDSRFSHILYAYIWN